MFIHVGPEEKETIRWIPRALLFPAPGLPEGHLLMGYDDRGQCPMLVDSKCSIYEHRPQTCRDYDCRLLAATGVPADEHRQPEIAQRVAEWVFAYETDEERAEHTALQRAAAFLENNRGLFPEGSLPGQPGPLAALAVRVYRVVANMTDEAHNSAAVPPDAAIAQAIMTMLNGAEDASGSTPDGDC
jgi:Fe-S-cluster containining protein